MIVTDLERLVVRWITDLPCYSLRPHYVMQPVCLRPLFKGHIHLAAQLLEKTAYALGPGLNRRFHHHFAGSIQYCDRNGCAMHVHTNIIRFHRALLRLYLKWCNNSKLLPLGRPFIYSVATWPFRNTQPLLDW